MRPPHKAPPPPTRYPRRFGGDIVDSSFALAFCQPGAERDLKAEVALLRPDLHAGFQRRGVVTFKCTGKLFGPEDTLPTVYARGWICSAGPAADAAAVLAVADKVGATRLLMGPRELPAVEDPGAVELAAALKASKRFAQGVLRKGEVVLDVITAPGEPAMVGWHVHHPTRPDAPCARWQVAPMEGPAARSYTRMVEGLRWSGVPIKNGDRAVDLAAGPGGATLALLERGALVWAVERQPMTDALAKNTGVVWVQRAMSEIRAEHLPSDTSWIVCDASLPTGVLVNVLRRLVLPLRPTLKGVLVSLKFDEAMTNTELLGQLGSLGAAEVKGVQLPSNRGSFFAFARFEPTGVKRAAATAPAGRQLKVQVPEPDEERRGPRSPRRPGPPTPGPKKHR